MHATDSPRTVRAPSFRLPRTLNTTAREHSGHHSCAALRCTALAPRGSRPRMTMRRVLGSPRRPRPGAQDQGPGYFGVTSHQQQATRSGFAVWPDLRGVAARRPPSRLGKKLRGNTRVRRDHAFLSWWSARVPAGGRWTMSICPLLQTRRCRVYAVTRWHGTGSGAMH